MELKSVLQSLHQTFNTCSTVLEVMAYLEALEKSHSVMVTFIFVSDTPATADAPVGVSVIDIDGEERSTAEINTASLAFAIRAGLNYDHPDLLMTHSEWHNPGSQALRSYHLTVQENSKDEDLDSITRAVPALNLVK